VLFASLVGTTIEFFDFYIYATAAVLVFPTLFFPSADPAAGTLQSLATFALAFFARPIGSALFGHFGDRIGRKATLVAALLTMGISTVVIGLLPTYATIGVLAPALLALCRFGQGLGLGGEWGGAVLLAMENAPPGGGVVRRVPAAGRAAGVLLSTGVFLLLTLGDGRRQFLAWGWRVPFSPARCGAGRPVGAPEHRRDAGVPAHARPGPTRAPADADGAGRASGRAAVGHVLDPGHVRDVLPDDGVRPDLGNHAAGLFAGRVPAAADGRRGVLRLGIPIAAVSPTAAAAAVRWCWRRWRSWLSG
jgi:hypothetical protein